jgi:hypothetical protein
MDATAKVVIGCWVAVISVWVAAAFSVKRARAKQPLPHRLLYLALTPVAAVLLRGSSGAIPWNRSLLPHTARHGHPGRCSRGDGPHHCHLGASDSGEQLERQGDAQGDP